MWDENNQFQTEKQVFQKLIGFKDVILSERVEDLKAEGKEEVIEMLFETLFIMIFNMLVYVKDNDAIKDIAHMFRQIITVSDPCLLRFKDYMLDHDSQEVVRILLKCPETIVRNAVAGILTTATNRLFEIEELGQVETKEDGATRLKAACELFMMRMLAAIRGEAQENWTKFEQFFKLIHDVVIGGQPQLDFFMEQNLLVTLADFFLAEKSPLKAQDETRPPIGSSYQKPMWESVVGAICYLARHKTTNNITADMESPPSSLLGDKPYAHSEDEYRLLVNKDFLTKAIEEGFEADQVGKLMAHWAFNNFDESQLFASVFVECINKAKFNEVSPFLSALHQYLLVPDAYQVERLEWIFGVAHLIDFIKPHRAKPDHLPKVGVEGITRVETPTVGYSSPLFWESQQTECLLSLVWRNRNYYPQYTLMCLNEIADLILEDERVHEFFWKVPSPTYQYGRFTDWFGEFVDKLSPAYANDEAKATFRSKDTVL